jgi:hypothetical protein
MKAWSISGLLFAAAILATVPMSPQSRGVELSVGQAQAQTYPGRGLISWYAYATPLVYTAEIVAWPLAPESRLPRGHGLQSPSAGTRAHAARAAEEAKRAVFNGGPEGLSYGTSERARVPL